MHLHGPFDLIDEISVMLGNAIADGGVDTRFGQDVSAHGCRSLSE